MMCASLMQDYMRPVCVCLRSVLYFCVMFSVSLIHRIRPTVCLACPRLMSLACANLLCCDLCLSLVLCVSRCLPMSSLRLDVSLCFFLSLSLSLCLCVYPSTCACLCVPLCLCLSICLCVSSDGTSRWGTSRNGMPRNDTSSNGISSI